MVHIAGETQFEIGNFYFDKVGRGAPLNLVLPVYGFRPLCHLLPSNILGGFFIFIASVLHQASILF